MLSLGALSEVGVLPWPPDLSLWLLGPAGDVFPSIQRCCQCLEPSHPEDAQLLLCCGEAGWDGARIPPRT